MSIIQDFAGSPRYANAHIFFISTVSNDILGILVKSLTVSYVKSVIDLNINFLMHESHVFHLDSPFNLSPEKYRHIASQLATVCITLGETQPVIKYQRVQSAQTLSFALDDYMRQYSSVGPTVLCPATVLIVDRSIDFVSPYLHEFTYQAMIYDLLEIKNHIYNYEIKASDGSEKKKSMY